MTKRLSRAGRGLKLHTHVMYVDVELATQRIPHIGGYSTGTGIGNNITRLGNFSRCDAKGKGTTTHYVYIHYKARLVFILGTYSEEVKFR